MVSGVFFIFDIFFFVRVEGKVEKIYLILIEKRREYFKLLKSLFFFNFKFSWVAIFGLVRGI